MFRAGLISLVVLMVAGCTSKQTYMQQSEMDLCTDFLRLPVYNVNYLTRKKAVEARGLDCSKYQQYVGERNRAAQKEFLRRWDKGYSATKNLLDTIDKPRREQNEFNRNLPLPTMPSTNYSAPPIDGCLNGTQWMMDSAGRWECQ
jgi:hypothetical protein